MARSFSRQKYARINESTSSWRIVSFVPKLLHKVRSRLALSRIVADYPTVLVTSLKHIVNEAWGLDTMDVPKLAKYMRCLVHVAMLDNMELAEQLIDSVHEQSREAAEAGFPLSVTGSSRLIIQQTDQPYPSEELEWIATRSFNYAVDLYCINDDNGCKNWAGKALNLAHYCTDEGALERTLQSRLVALKFES